MPRAKSETTISAERRKRKLDADRRDAISKKLAELEDPVGCLTAIRQDDPDAIAHASGGGSGQGICSLAYWSKRYDVLELLVTNTNGRVPHDLTPESLARALRGTFLSLPFASATIGREQVFAWAHDACVAGNVTFVRACLSHLYETDAQRALYLAELLDADRNRAAEAGYHKRGWARMLWLLFLSYKVASHWPPAPKGKSVKAKAILAPDDSAWRETRWLALRYVVTTSDPAISERLQKCTRIRLKAFVVVGPEEESKLRFFRQMMESEFKWSLSREIV